MGKRQRRIGVGVTLQIHEIEKQQAVDGQRIGTLETGHRDIWTAVQEIGRDVGRIKVEVAKVVSIVGIAQVIITGVMVWALTKDKEAQNAAGQVHKSEVPYLVDGSTPGPGARR